MARTQTGTVETMTMIPIKVLKASVATELKAITMSSKADNPEFVVHIKSEYDYRYESSFRDEIFAAIKHTA